MTRTLILHLADPQTTAYFQLYGKTILGGHQYIFHFPVFSVALVNKFSSPLGKQTLKWGSILNWILHSYQGAH